MKRIPFILLACVLLVSCNEKKPYRPTAPPPVVKKDSVRSEKNADTLRVEQEQQPQPPSRSAAIKNNAPVRPAASNAHALPQYDNMRGFDPASEDDMDDNGMSRYMDNNDDEGWY
ncbi:MAG: hypothetical protein IKX36_06130 [Prevotella sp.]|nr:hypothetical protein [Prevotella sp.]